MNNYRATPKQWEKVENWSSEMSSTDSCVLELRDRVMALEAQANHIGDINKMVPPPVARVTQDRDETGNYVIVHDTATPLPVATDAGRLMDRVSIAIMSVEDEDDDDDDPSFKYTSAAIELGMDASSLQARAAILEVARWLGERGGNQAAILLRREALSND